MHNGFPLKRASFIDSANNPFLVGHFPMRQIIHKEDEMLRNRKSGQKHDTFSLFGDSFCTGPDTSESSYNRISSEQKTIEILRKQIADLKQENLGEIGRNMEIENKKNCFESELQECRSDMVSLRMKEENHLEKISELIEENQSLKDENQELRDRIEVLNSKALTDEQRKNLEQCKINIDKITAILNRESNSSVKVAEISNIIDPFTLDENDYVFCDETKNGHLHEK